jgi:hypothetical protein
VTASARRSSNGVCRVLIVNLRVRCPSSPATIRARTTVRDKFPYAKE